MKEGKEVVNEVMVKELMVMVTVVVKEEVAVVKKSRRKETEREGRKMKEGR